MATAAREVTARFRVDTVSEPYDGQVSVTLQVDYADGRNQEWAKYTPWGEIRIGLKEEVAKGFPLNQPFLVTFTPEG